MNWNGDPHTSWTISVTVSNVRLKNLNGIRIHDLCAAGAVLLLTMNHEPTQMWAGQFLDSCVPVKEMFMKCGWGMNIEKMILTVAGKSQLLSHMCTYDNTGIILVFEMNEWIWSWHLSAALATSRNAWTGLNPDLCHASAGLLKIHRCVTRSVTVTNSQTVLCN